MARFGRAFPSPPHRRPRYVYPTFDAAGAGSVTAGTTVTETHVVKGNCIIALGMTWANTIATSVTCGGVAMTSLGSVNNNANAANGGVQAWGLMFPPKGSQTVQFNLPSAPSFVALNSLSYFNVGSIGSLHSGAGTAAATPSLVEASTVGWMWVNAISGYGIASGVTQSGYTQNSRYAPAGQGSEVLLIAGDGLATSTSITFSVTYSTSGTWNFGGVAIPLVPMPFGTN